MKASANMRLYDFKEVGRSIPKNILKSEKFQKPPLPPLRSKKTQDEVENNDRNLPEIQQSISVQNKETNMSTLNPEQTDKNIQDQQKIVKQMEIIQQQMNNQSTSFKRRFPKNVKTGEEDIWQALSKHQMEVVNKNYHDQQQRKVKNQQLYKLELDRQIEIKKRANSAQNIRKEARQYSEGVTLNKNNEILQSTMQPSESQCPDPNNQQNRLNQINDQTKQEDELAKFGFKREPIDIDMIRKQLIKDKLNKFTKQKIQKAVLDQQLKEIRQRNQQQDIALQKSPLIQRHNKSQIIDQKSELIIDPNVTEELDAKHNIRNIHSSSMTRKYQIQQQYLSAIYELNKQKYNHNRVIQMKKYHADLDLQVQQRKKTKDAALDELEKFNYYDLMAYRNQDQKLYSKIIGMEDLQLKDRYQKQMERELFQMDYMQNINDKSMQSLLPYANNPNSNNLTSLQL
ncbi:UNKNOWN [Stylonychia lemnae]|uniref:Uncharacterized protein n=1 Tax=Stylonychia lemnae TaxID=5949 RepID=A0A077ZX35_STYLE|nr:UNKNOWN [Stylonychia lemnae]|eukprot:CDW74455.1 UNKNOWN [Stylonychia lemnae]